jgi:uroporphyrinogen-III decarboxylase
MLTKRQNFLETIRGGKPDRFVNQFDYLSLLFGADPIAQASPFPAPGCELVNGWGVTIRWIKGQPGGFPVHDAAHKVVKDITRWKDAVKAPEVNFSDEKWAEGIKTAEAIDRNETFATVGIFPGIFEQLHFLMGVDDCLASFYEEPEALKGLIEFIADWEISYAEVLTKYLKPDALFHHDDWGSQYSSFMSPEMFDEFLLPAYKRIYGFYKSHGVEIIVHHSDSYAANLIPQMIEMGIDVFQGCLTTNNVPELVKKYGGKISFMGDLNNGVIDKEDWTPELVRKEVERACKTNGKHYFIPCLCQGLPMSTFPHVYEAVSAEIDRVSKEMF